MQAVLEEFTLSAVTEENVTTVTWGMVPAHARPGFRGQPASSAVTASMDPPVKVRTSCETSESAGVTALGLSACSCSEHGSCDDGRRGTGLCFCEEGWTGERCDVQQSEFSLLGSPLNKDFHNKQFVWVYL